MARIAKYFFGGQASKNDRNSKPSNQPDALPKINPEFTSYNIGKVYLVSLPIFTNFSSYPSQHFPPRLSMQITANIVLILCRAVFLTKTSVR